VIAPDGSGMVRLPAELLAQLGPELARLGIQSPETAMMVPRVNLDTTIREMGMQLGKILRRSGMYRVGPSRKVKAMRDGKFREMNALWFCSWVECYVQVVRSRMARGEVMDVPASMGKDLAAKLLETDELLNELPIVERVVPVRSPVRRADGRVELMKVGYDEEARVFCLDEVRFDEGWDVGRALGFIEGLCGGFPFAEYEVGKGQFWSNRSALVHVGVMLGVFCRLMLPAGTVRPLVLYTANDQGSGKSLLVSMVLAGVFGGAASTDLPMSQKGLNPEKFTALLETVAQSMKEYLWLDDVPGSVFSNALNRFVTAAVHTGRKYGGNDELFEAEAVTQVFMTGNQVGITRDILQRALVVELFLPVDSQSRSFELDMTPMWLAMEEQRAGLLSACWGLVRHWVEVGMPMGKTVQRRAPQWSRLVGGLLEAAGVSVDAFAVPVLPVGGDEESEEWKRLLVALADDAEVDPFAGDEGEAGVYVVDMKRIVEKARGLHVLSDLVGADGDKDLKGGELKRLGRRLAKWRGREDLVATSGRRFQFGKRKQASNWVYPISWMD
jgi:hypothetical protein